MNIEPEIFECAHDGCSFYSESASRIEEHRLVHSSEFVRPLSAAEREFGSQMARALLERLEAAKASRATVDDDIVGLLRETSCEA